MGNKFRRLIVLSGLIFLFAGLGGAAFANPFTDGRPVEMPSTPFSASMPILKDALIVQQKIHATLAAKITDLKEGKSLAPLWELLLLGFLYGVFHILAPGHGKSIVGSWFIGNEARKTDGFWAGAIMAAGHTLTSVFFVGVLNLILGFSQFGVIDRTRYAELVGYGLIAGIGLWLIVKAFRRPLHVVGCGCSCGAASHDHSVLKNKQAMGLFGVASLVPCSGSMIILLFTLANGVFWAGILAVVAIALGMFITITAIGTATIFLRRALLERENPSRARRIAVRCVEIAAGCFVLTSGGLLFTGTLLGLLA
jgi:ABC-type nickel/cobalt efflux system permease component RcnA